MREFSRVLSILFSLLALIYWLAIGDTAACIVAMAIGLVGMYIPWRLARTTWHEDSPRHGG
jgi:hypothetical protein